jgi:tetratricopeptide (TPR) repeat protein
MRKRRKTILYSGVGIAALAIIILSAWILITNPYRNKIPALPDMQTFSLPLREQLTGAYNRARHNPTAKNLGMLGTVFHSSSCYDQAGQCYELAIKRNSQEWIWNYYLGYLKKEMGENEAVIENFSKVTEKIPENYLAWFYIAEGYQAMGSNEKAEAVYNKIISQKAESLSPSNSARKDYFSLRSYAMFQLATIYIGTGRIDMAEKTLKELILNQRSFGQAYRLLGSVYSIRGDNALSKECISRAADLMIYTPPVDTIIDQLARQSRSELYLMKQVDDAEKGGYSQFAMQLLDNAMVNIPGDKFLISKAIKLYLLMDMGQLAGPYFDKHLVLFNEDIDEIKMVADLCMKKGFYSQAVKYYDRAARLRPDDIDVHLSLVLCLGNEGKKQQALDSMNLLLEEHPENLRVLTDGMYVMMMLGENSKAVAILSTLKRLFPGNPKVLQLSGLLLQQEGKDEQAAAMLESSFKGDPSDLSTVRYLGDLLAKQNLWEKTIICYRKALEYNPNEPYLQESLGTLLVLCPDTKLRNPYEGKEYSERAFINKSSPTRTIISAGISMSEAYAMLGDKKNARNSMTLTIHLAERQKAPAAFVDGLRKRLDSYKD